MCKHCMKCSITQMGQITPPLWHFGPGKQHGGKLEPFLLTHHGPNPNWPYGQPTAAEWLQVLMAITCQM